jgi:hypothetical protein
MKALIYANPSKRKKRRMSSAVKKKLANLRGRVVSKTKTKGISMARRKRKAPKAVRKAKGISSAVRRKIAARIRALHRSGHYGKRKTKAVRRIKSRRSGIRRSVRRSVARKVRRSSVHRIKRGRRNILTITARTNPSVVKQFISSQNLVVAAGAVGATLLTQLAATAIGSKFPVISANPVGRIAFKVGVPLLGALAVRKVSKNLSDGMIVGAAIMAISEAIGMFKGGVDGVGEYLGEYLGDDLGLSLDGPADYASFAGPDTEAMVTSGAFPTNPWARR